MKYETVGGTVTREETYRKITHHLDELEDLCYIMSHLHRTETGRHDELIATGWRAIGQMMKLTREQMRKLAEGRVMQ